MKLRIVFLLLLILSAFDVFGQELTVKKMEMVPMDLSASTQPRNDRNGNPCALVKVLMVDDISRVEGNVIGDVEDRGTEKWVYLSAGTKMMRIIPKNHLPLMIMFGDYGIKKVEGKVTYELILLSATSVVNNDLQKVEAQVSKPVEPASKKVSQSSTSAYNNIDMDRQEAQSADDSGFITVKGTVVDRHSEPVIGCSIYVDGTKTGTVSDYNGQFTIKVPVQGKTKLRFGFVGMKTKYVTIDKIKNPVLKVVMR